MNMKKMILAMGAALVAVIGASPASATVYTYTRTDGIKVVIDNVAQTGTFIGTAVNGGADLKSVDLRFSGAGLANFKGGSVNFTTALTTFTGTLTNAAGRVFTAKSSGPLSLTLRPSASLWNVTNNGVTWTTDGLSGDYTQFFLGTLTSTVEPPSPASARIFQYTSNSTGDTLTINTLTRTGTFNNGLLNMRFTSNDFAAFTGGANPVGTFIFTSLSGGGAYGNIVNTNLADVGLGRPRINFEGANPPYIILRGIQFGNHISDWNWGPVLNGQYKVQNQGGQ